MEIKTIDEAIEFLQTKAGINVEIMTAKYRVSDFDMDSYIEDDKQLIEYAKEQQEAIGEEEVCDECGNIHTKGTGEPK